MRSAPGMSISRSSRRASSRAFAPALYLRADLDQLLFQAGQRPVRDRLGRRQRAQEIAEIVGERMKLEPNNIGSERFARQPRLLDRVLAFLDPRLARAALIVEGDNMLGRPGQVGDDESDAGVKFAGITADNYLILLACAEASISTRLSPFNPYVVTTTTIRCGATGR